MAGIPMYYGIPTSGEVEAGMARDKMDVLRTEKAQLEMNDLKDQYEYLKELNRVEQAKNVPVGYGGATPPQMPGSSVIPPGTMGNLGGPVGAQQLPAQGGAMAPGGWDANAAIQEKKEEAPPTVLQNMKNTGTELNSAQERVAFMYKFADGLRKRGNLTGWQDATKKASELEKDMYDTQVKHFNAQDKFLDLTSGLAYGYTKAVQGNPNDQLTSDKAWNTLLMQLQSNGIPSSQLAAITDPAQRLQLAGQYMDSALGGKERIKLEIANNKLALDEKKLAALTDYRNRRITNEERLTSLKERKFDQESAKVLLNTYESDIRNLRNNIAQEQRNLTNTFDETEKAKINGRIASMQQELSEQVKARSTAVDAIKAKAKEEKVDFNYTPEKEGASKGNADIEQERKNALSYYNSPNATPEIKEKIKKMFKDKTGQELQVDETAPAADSLMPSTNFKPLPKKVDVTKRQSAVKPMIKDPITLEDITPEEYRKKYGESPR